MQSKRITLRALAFLVSLVFLYAAPAAGRKSGIDASAALSDFRIMNTIFTQAHATAFSQMPGGEVPDIFKDIKRVSVRELVMRVLRYYRGIHVDHTGLGFSPELVNELGLRNALFPFPLKFFGARAYFDCDFEGIPFGTELTHLNGQTLPQLLEELNGVSGVKDTRGEWDDYRLAEHFSFLYYMAKGEQTEWKLTLTGDAETKPRLITYKNPDNGNAPLVKRRSSTVPQYGQPLYMMFNPSLKAAYLAINSFMPSAGQLDSIQSWNNYLNLFHQEAKAKQAENLVIDLRMNRGGVMLFSAAAATWFIETKINDKSRSGARTRVLPYRQYAQAINGMPVSDPMLKDTEQHLQKTFADKMTDGYFETRQNEARYLDLIPIREAHRFKKIYILIGSATYSAAVNFARLMKLGNKNVVLVGEETGSPGDGHSAEILVTYKLPASGLLFEIPLVRVQFSPLAAGQVPRRGLMPDMAVKEAVQDFIASRDSVLESASRAMIPQ